MKSTLEEWRDTLRLRLFRPQPFVIPERLDEYRGHIGAALAVVDAALARGQRENPRQVDDGDWERIREHMRLAAWCAFPAPASVAVAAEEAMIDPVSGVREVARESPPPVEPPVSLRRIIAFFKKASNS